MPVKTSRPGLTLIFFCGSLLCAFGQGPEKSPTEGKLVVFATNPAPYQIPRNLTGKFCEHLGANIYNGMDAQILRNPTFADYPFATGATSPDGIVTFISGSDQIESELKRESARWGWPESDVPDMLAARRDGMACFWSRTGTREDIQVSPDTGPGGGRAQRIEFKTKGGIKQWTWLPLHRIRKYEFELLARSPELTQLRIALIRSPSENSNSAALMSGLKPDWAKLSGTLTLNEDSPADVPYCLLVSADSPGQIVISHLFLRPSDHINGADPDVVRLLKAAHLPLLRWPGGNFVSTYHWEDGVGPLDRRPTRPNYAWGGIEPNTFGTDEFIGLCRAIGCEPMICLNAGTGTPEEAAGWLEYCNAAANSGLGARRAANGHSEPFHVRHWEVGNELWGRWQANWTTAAGYVDRYRRFAHAMLQADPSIQLYACGAPVLWGKSWNDTLITGAASTIRSLTDHPLIGGDLSQRTEPLDVFRDFMLVPDVLERKWNNLRQDMQQGGITDPHLAVTELQMFAHLAPDRTEDGALPLNRQNLVSPGTLGEALYDTLFYHAAVRLQPFVELITHSATVNHGGGLRKEHERVYANPCYYANLLFADFAQATPLTIQLTSPRETAPKILPDIQKVEGESSFNCLAALVALDSKGDILISLVHRGTAGPIRTLIQVQGLSGHSKARLQTLSGPTPWSANTLRDPQAVRLVVTEQDVLNGEFSLLLQPFSVVQVRLRSS